MRVRKSGKRRAVEVCGRWAGAALVALCAGACEELGPDARGEISTTALQTVGDDRACVPLDDMTAARPNEDAVLRVLLRDGTEWHNDLRGVCPAIARNHEVAFVTETGDACTGDELLLLQRTQGIVRLADTCVLGRFVQQ